MVKLFIGLVRLYQTFISPLFPPSCRYQPTCSNYMIEALNKHGLKGLLMGLARIGRCHPFVEGGDDPVPDTFSLRRNKHMQVICLFFSGFTVFCKRRMFFQKILHNYSFSCCTIQNKKVRQRYEKDENTDFGWNQLFVNRKKKQMKWLWLLIQIVFHWYEVYHRIKRIKSISFTRVLILCVFLFFILIVLLKYYF